MANAKDTQFITTYTGSTPLSAIDPLLSIFYPSTHRSIDLFDLLIYRSWSKMIFDLLIYRSTKSPDPIFWSNDPMLTASIQWLGVEETPRGNESYMADPNSSHESTTWRLVFAHIFYLFCLSVCRLYYYFYLSFWLGHKVCLLNKRKQSADWSVLKDHMDRLQENHRRRWWKKRGWSKNNR